ncbi:DUF5667 domain-containing protein [Streptomyces avicenniae]|uniref:DUF5667 domain-containing protein n=1 Tax=Streptomyces avicenniae TaxID=500153 RepID=UPI00069B2A73|nr:DUF5667 domain-containing protein [Streptomyces avicenniae]
MIGSVSANRRANAFAHLLDEPRLAEPRSGDPATAADIPADARDQTALLAVADRLAALPRPELAPETKVAQRAGLLAAMQEAFADGTAAESPPRAEQVPAQRRPRGGRGLHRAVQGGALARLRPRSRLTKGLAAGGLTMGVAAGAFGGVAAASTDALPGDTLYGLKRGMEDLRLDFADGDTDRGRVHLDLASTRMSEARRLLERGRSGPLDLDDLAEIRRALSSMCDDVAAGHRLLSQAYAADGSLGPIQSLSAFSEGHRNTWTLIRRQLPPELRDVGTEVSHVFDRMDDDIAPLQSLLPAEPRRAAAADAGTGPPAGTDADASASTTPSSPTPPSGDDSPAAGPDERRTPAERDGLLGGVDLLDPEPGTPGESTEEAPSSRPTTPRAQLPQPDITIPPLVDDLLPGLGLDVGERDQD